MAPRIPFLRAHHAGRARGEGSERAYDAVVVVAGVNHETLDARA